MRATSSVPRRAGAAVLLAGLVALAALTGCDARETANPSASGAQGTGSLAGDSSADPTAAPTKVAPTSVAGQTYPNTAQAYAQLVMNGWMADNGPLVQSLANEATFEGIFGLSVTGYDTWTFLRCDGAAGSSYCSFTNPNGDVVTLRVSNQLLGQAHAAVGVQLDKTIYPNEGVAYVKEFVKAWQFGNTARMLKLSKPAVVDEVPGPPTGTITYPEPTCCGGGLLQVKVKWGGVTATFDVGTTLLGGPNAILDYDQELGLTS